MRSAKKGSLLAKTRTKHPRRFTVVAGCEGIRETTAFPYLGDDAETIERVLRLHLRSVLGVKSLFRLLELGKVVPRESGLHHM